jgi:hypothetical protein
MLVPLPKEPDLKKPVIPNLVFKHASIDLRCLFAASDSVPVGVNLL